MASPSTLAELQQSAGATLDPDTENDLMQSRAMGMAQVFGGGPSTRIGMFDILGGQAASLEAQRQRLATMAAQNAVANMSPQGDGESDADYQMRLIKTQRDAAMQYSPDLAARMNTQLLMLAAQKNEQAKLQADTALENNHAELEATQNEALKTKLPLAQANAGLVYVASPNINSPLGYNLQSFDISTPEGNAAYLKARAAPNTTALAPEDAAKLMAQADVAKQRLLGEQMKMSLTYGQTLSPDALQYATYLTMANPSELRSLSGYGQAGAIVRKQIMDNVAAVAKQSGISPQDLASIQSTIKAEGGSIGGLTKMLNNVSSFETLMHANGDRLLQLIGNVDVTGVPAFEGAIRWAKARGGNVDTNELRSVLNSFQTEAARILTSPTLSGTLTEGARKDMQQIVGGNLDAPSMVRIIKRLYTEGDVRKAGIVSAIQGAQGTVGGMLTGGLPAFTAPTSPPAAATSPPPHVPTFDPASGTFK